MHIRSLILASVAALGFTAAASAQDILIDISFTPVYEKSAPVAGIPGKAASQKSYYQSVATTSADDKLASNQCWTSASMERMTAGTQGPKGICVWNNGSLSSVGGSTVGIAAVAGVYGQGWAGLDIPAGSHPLDFSDKHDLIHEHTCTGQSAPSSVDGDGGSC